MSVVTFGIPLISARVARDWAAIQRLLVTTLRSALNQSVPDIRIVIACHERPEIAEANDPRIIIKQVDFDIPRFRWEMEVDRMRKLEVLGSELRRFGGGWLFILDGDDYVASDLADSIIRTDAKAVVIKNGYRLNLQTGKYQVMSKFYGKCGSCSAVNWNVDELPERALADNPPLYHEFCEARHYTHPKFFEARKWKWEMLEKRLATYVINHGSNQSEVITTDSLRWKLYFKLRKWYDWTPELDTKFGVTLEAREASLYEGEKTFSTESRF